MKNLLIFCFLIAATSFSTLNAQEAIAVNAPIETAVTPALKWDQTTFDFKEIPQNVPAKATFTLTNTSDQPLLLKEVKPSCGCTVASYEQEPILPGASTLITTTYNAKKAGRFQKTIKVLTNLNDKHIPLKLKGEVITQ